MTLKKIATRSCALGLPLFALLASPLGCSDGTGAAPASGATAPAARPLGRQLVAGHVPALAASVPVVRRLEATAQMSLSIGLPLRNADGLKEVAQQVSDPTSASYRKYLTPDQVAASYGPSEADYQAVIDFAHAQGLTVVHTFSNRLLVHVSGAAADVERAFHVTMNVHRRSDGSEFFAPDQEPSLDLDAPILHVAGLDNTVAPRPLGHARPVEGGAKPMGGSGPNGGLYDGADLRTAYASCTTATGTGQILGLFEMDGYTPSDIVAYDQFGATGLRQVPLKNILLGGVTGAAGSASDEVTADIEMANAMAPGLTQIDVFEGPDTIPAVDVILASMSTTLPLANQLSSSWGPVIDANAQQFFNVFTAQGQSFFQASGDSGAYPMNLQAIVDANDITLVGGTDLNMNGAGVSYASETALNEDGMLSGGGVECCEPSVPLPLYQTWVPNALNKASKTNRNVPDVSMVAGAAFIFWKNNYYAFYGTSLSAPLWAGFMALANQESAVNGVAPVGFANPDLYYIANTASTYASNFNDITVGNNGAYNAVAGYDLVTGLGTPKCGLVQALATPSLGRCESVTLRASRTSSATFYEGITANVVIPATIQPGDSSSARLEFMRNGNIELTCNYAGGTGAVENCTAGTAVVADHVIFQYGPFPLGYATATLRWSIGTGVCTQ